MPQVPAAAPQAGDTASFWAPPYDGSPLLRTTPALESAATSTGDGGGYLAVGAAALLAAATLLLVQRLRRRAVRTC